MASKQTKNPNQTKHNKTNAPKHRQELRKAAEQRAREAVMTQGEAAKALRDERAAFERREAALQAGLREARESGDATAKRAESLASQLSAVGASAASLQASLESKTAAEGALQAQLDQVGSRGRASCLAARIAQPSRRLRAGVVGLCEWPPVAANDSHAAWAERRPKPSLPTPDPQAQAQLSELRAQLATEQTARTAMTNDLRAAQNQVRASLSQATQGFVPQSGPCGASCRSQNAPATFSAADMP